MAKAIQTHAESDREPILEYRKNLQSTVWTLDEDGQGAYLLHSNGRFPNSFTWQCKTVFPAGRNKRLRIETMGLDAVHTYDKPWVLLDEVDVETSNAADNGTRKPTAIW